MQIDETIIYYWLGISGLTSRRANALAERYSPFDLWEKVGRTVTDPALFGEKTYAALLRFRNETYLTQSIARLDAQGIGFLPYNRFPDRMQQRETDPPVMLYYRGNARLLQTDCVAVVGTRACSAYGKDATARLCTDLCRYGVTVVSGLATGVDTYAHRAALRAGGNTIAVLGSGLNCVTPTSNKSLHDEIVQNGGLILSEYAPQADATRYTFPERNRIISAVSSGVIVVEAPEKSGALITADFALEQNRTVFAVPGNITSNKSVGSNRLLYEGAVPALCAEDICSTLHFSCKNNTEKNNSIQLDIFEQKIYNILQSGEKNFDALVEQAQMPPPSLAALLSAMEIKGIIVKKQANTYGVRVL